MNDQAHAHCIFLVMMLQNSSSETSPSWSRSALVINSWISCSEIVYPRSWATLLRFLADKYPVLSSSYMAKTFPQLTLLFLSPILVVIKASHSVKSMLPFPSASKSQIIWKIAPFLDQNPKEVMAALSYLVSTDPPRSVSNKSKAAFIYSTCSTLTPSLANLVLSNPVFFCCLLICQSNLIYEIEIF